MAKSKKLKIGFWVCCALFFSIGVVSSPFGPVKSFVTLCLGGFIGFLCGFLVGYRHKKQSKTEHSDSKATQEDRQ